MADDDVERTGSGAPVWRHAPAPDVVPEAVSGGDPELIEAVTAHVERTLGPVDWVFHEILSPHVHIDVLRVEPTEEHPFRTLVSCGMSERPMPAAPHPEVAFAELFVTLPPDWPVDEDAFADERNYWPVRLLKQLARLPHEHGTWLWMDQTVATDDPPEPYAEDTSLCAALVAPPVVAPEAFHFLERDGVQMPFFSIFPLHADELRVALAKGVDALYDRIERSGIEFALIDPQRPSVGGRRRKRFGLF